MLRLDPPNRIEKSHRPLSAFYCAGRGESERKCLAREVLRANALEGRSERGKPGIHRLSVGHVRLEENVNVFRKPGWA